MAEFQETVNAVAEPMIALAKKAAEITPRWFAYFDAKYMHDAQKNVDSKTGMQVSVAPAVPFPVNLSLGEDLQIRQSLQDTTNLRCGLYMWGLQTPVVLPTDLQAIPDPSGTDTGQPQITPDVPEPSGPPPQTPGGS